MEIEKYSPKWLLLKINNSKTDAHKLMYIIDYRKELEEDANQRLIKELYVVLDEYVISDKDRLPSDLRQYLSKRIVKLEELTIKEK
jgi:hypothetical protein